MSAMAENSKKQVEDLTQKAYMGIRSMLFHNEIVPGQKIAYRELADRFEMSITPVAHALKWLELQGLVRREINKGYYAEPISLKQVEEIYDLRSVLETSLLPTTLALLDKKGIERLKKALEASLSSLRGDSLSVKLIKDMEFHLTLASLSQRKTQQTVLGQMYDLLYLKYRSSLSFGISMRSVVESDHQHIFDYVAAKDLANAKKVLNRHIIHAKKHAIKGLEQAFLDKNNLPSFSYGSGSF
jgi:DNA-binding GntR family transcriptional regulator